MAGRFVHIAKPPVPQHKCEMPEVDIREHGVGTTWQCECTKLWMLGKYEYLKAIWYKQ